MKKRLLSWLLVLVMIFSLIPSTLVSAWAADVSGAQEITFDDQGVWSPTQDGVYKVSGDQTGNIIQIKNGIKATLLLNGATLSAATSPIQIESGATLTLVVADNSDNSIVCTATAADDTNGGMTAGIHVPDGATLTIDTPENGAANGKLAVTGGYGGAGIGGGAAVGVSGETNPTTAGAGSAGPNANAWNSGSVVGTVVGGTGGSAGTSGYNGNDAEAAGTVDIKNGVLTVTGGYGGAGIGGGLGATGGIGTVAGNGGNGGNSAMCYNNRELCGAAGGGAGGQGGIGGLGGDGGNGGTVTIDAGTLTITAGQGAAGIGGGAGGTGGVGGHGGNGGNGGKEAYENRTGSSLTVGAGGGGQGGQGGHGGSGGVGGSGGTLTVNGGTLNITSDNSAGIGGGAGGVGGQGGDGGNGGDGHSLKTGDTAETATTYSHRGDAGVGGNGGEGGVGTALTVRGGLLTINGSANDVGGGDAGTNGTDGQIGEDGTRNGPVPQAWGTGNWPIRGWASTEGGAAGTSAAPAHNQANGAGDNVVIDGTQEANIWAGVSVNGTSASIYSRPQDVNGNDLYLYTLSVKQMDNQSSVSGAKVVLKNVQGDNGDAYTYTAVSNANGEAQLWLPKGTYTMQDKDVFHDTEGWIPASRSLTFTVEERDNQGGNAMIGANFTLTASTTDKVYFSDDEKPVTLTVDATSITRKISSVRWFVEPIAGTANQYDATADVVNNIKAFSDGYTQAEAAGNAVAQLVTDDTHTFSIPINENGHYWVEVTYQTGSGATSASVVNPITVTNIYRKYPVTVRSYVNEGLDSSGNEIVASDTGYVALPDAAGVAQNVEYGFAWDLNGYDAAALDSTKLLEAAIAPYDEITLYAKSTYHTWYNATLLGNTRLFAEEVNDQGKVTGYQPIKLTLNPDFLSDKNLDCDVVNGVRDYSKYTIRYDAKDGALDIVTITGTADGVAEPFYTHTRSYTEAIDSDSITAIAWPEYKLVGVKVNGVDANLDEDEDGNQLSSVTITDIHDKTGGFKNKIKTVEFIYQYNMTEVTINYFLKDTTTSIEGSALSRKEKMEIGKEYIGLTNPEVAGYDAAGSSLTDGKFTPTGTNDSITYYYTKAKGNVTYKAVADQKTLWTGSGTVAKDAVPADVTPDYGITGYVKNDAKATKYQKADGSDYGNENKYDGVNDMVVIYTYKHITRNVVVQQIDSTNDKVLHEADAVSYNVGEYPTIAAGTAPAGYEIVGEDSRVVPITEGTDDLIVKFYYRPSTTASVTIKLYEADDSGNKIAGKDPFQTMTVKVAYGQEQTINAPEITGWEVTGKKTETVNVKAGETAPEIEFLYKPVYDTITVYAKIQGAAEGTAPLLTETYQVQQGQSFKAAAPSVDKYKLADGQDATKTLSAAEIKDGTRSITFEYVKAQADLFTITVESKTTDGKTLYTYEVQAVADNGSYDIDAKKSITGYTLESATIDGVDKKDSITETGKLNVPAPANGGIGPVKVVLTYKSTKTTVTVKAKCGTEELNAYTYTVEKEIDAETSVLAPSIPGYTATEQSKKITPKGNDEVVFEYTKNTGNVVLIAKVGSTELFRQDGGTKTNGDTIDAAAFIAPTVTYYERTADQPTIKVNGNAFTSGDQYDGIGQIEITYQYQRKITAITIVKKDLDTHKDLNQNQDISRLTVGETYVFNQTVTTPNGYSAVTSENPTSVFVEDRSDQQVVFWYRQNEDSRYVTITVNLKCGNEIFETYTVRAIKGQGTTVGRPKWTGYTPVDTEEGYKTVTPTDNTTVVEFNYELDDPKTITVKLNNNTANTELQAPDGYQTSYTLKNGDEITIHAPIMSGFTLNGYTISNGGSNGTSQFVKVTHAGVQNGTVITFNYVSVVNSSFVKHSVRFEDHKGNLLYSYEKMIPKGTGNGTQIEYKESDVKNLIPGYRLANIAYKVAGNIATADQVTNMVDAEIIYMFDEDTAKIIVEQYNGDPDNGGTKLADDVELTGYRIGQTNIVVTAPARTDVALNDSLTKTVTGPLTATQTVKFQYQALSNVLFYLYDADTGNLIAIKNGKAGETYKAGEGILNLATDHYTYVADDRANNEAFKPNGTGTVTAPNVSGISEYSVYFEKATRKVTYIAMDSDKLSQDDFATATDRQKEDAKITGLNLAAMPDARVGETYMATAQTFDGWTLDDDLTKPYTVTNEQGNLEVYFWYKVRATGNVTVYYVCGTKGGANNDTLASYTTKAAGGEKLTITPPQNLGDNRYTLNAGQTAQTIDVNRNGDHEVYFYYSKNFVTISTKIVLGTAQPSEITSLDVLKNGTADFFPPYRPGYKLVGVTGVDGGTETKLPDGFNDKVTVSNPTADMDITWYYEQTDATEYQSTVTVKYIYRGHNLSAEKTTKAFIGVDNTIEVPAFDGYTAKTYTFKDGSGAESTATDITDASAGIVVKPNEKTAVLTITYERTDGSVVLPGADDEIAPPQHKDNVTVTPGNGTQLEDNGNGGVKVPDNGTATVTRPDPDSKSDGKEDIIVPGGTTIDKDGTIHLPNNGGEIKPGDKLPEKTPTGYVSVVYKANGGTGDDVIVVVAERTTITAIDNPFTYGSQKFSGWSTTENGIGGKTYAVGADIEVPTGANSVTLYAQWGKSTNFKYSATITYMANDGTQDKVEDTVGANDSTTFSVNLRTNPFAVSGWDFGGWNTVANGSGDLKAANAEIEVENGKDQTWYAQWYKVNAEDSITVPGKDGDPTTANDNVTANGNGNPVTRDPATGDITIPAGGNVVKGNETIALPDGAVLKPDGSLTINKPNGGTIDVDKDGNPNPNANAVVLTYEANNGTNDTVKVYATKGEDIAPLAANTFVYSGHLFLYWKSGNTIVKTTDTITPTDAMTLLAVWAKVNPDGSIELPGKDGKLDGPNGEEKDNVIVTPDSKDGLEGPKADDGSVKVNPGHDATVTRPDPEDAPNKEDIKVPEGTIIYPDGTIELPDGTKVTPDQPFPDDAGTYVTVTFKAGSGTGNTVKLVVKNGDPITLLDESVFVAPANHYFIGWTSGNKTYDANAQYTVTGAVTFTAQFKQIQTGKAVVTFDFNGGTANGKTYETRTGDPGTKLGELPTPTRGGYTFVGWNEQITADTEFGAENSTTTYTAQWTEKTYTIHYNGNGATGNVADQTYVFDTADAKLAQNSFTLADKVFLGWSVNKDATSAMFREGEEIGDALRAVLTNLDKTSESELTLYAIWKDNQVTPSEAIAIFDFAGGHDANGNTSIRKTGTAETTITVVAPTREGYTFAGWDKGEPKFGKTGTVTVFTAQWTANKFTVTFDVGDDNKGEMSGNASVQVDYSSSVEAGSIPTVNAKTGFTFIGWSDATSIYSAEAVKTYKVTADVTFTAQYEEDSKAVAIFDYAGGKDADGKSSASMSGNAGAVITIADPTREGYTFAGWKIGDQDVTDMKFGDAGSITIYTAVWTTDPDKTFKVNFVVDPDKGDVTGTTEFDVVSGNFVTEVPTVKAKDGYTFIGWSDGHNTYFTSGVKLYAITSATTFTALFEKADSSDTPTPPAKDTLTVTADVTTAKRGDKVNFKALLNGKETDNVTWTVTGGKTGTTISEAGVLTVGSSETNGTILTITASSKTDSTLTASTVLVVVVDSGNTGGGGGGTVTTSYTITASAGKGGSISPDGTVKVSRGDNKTFTISASNGYIIADVLVDGVSVGAVSSYTFEKISKDHTISVTFKEARPGVVDPSETGVDQWLRVTDHISYMHGYDNGNYGPMDNLTRAQAAQLFYRLLVNQDVTITVSFSDVPADAWYAKAVNTLASLGIIKGIGNGKFDPDREISRAEFVVIATRFAKTIDKASSPFVDVADDAWYAPYVATATSYGWITGVGEGRFAPDDLVTRAEAATIVNRMLARSADRDFIDGNAVQQFPDVTPNDWYYYQVMEAVNGHSHRYGEDGYEIWNGLANN